MGGRKGKRFRKQVSGRNLKRQTKRLNEKKNEFFNKLAQGWIVKMLEIGLDFQSKDAEKLFDEYDKKWRDYARLFITKNYEGAGFNKTENRTKQMEAFTVFAKKFVDEQEAKAKQAKAEPKEGFVFINGVNYSIESVQEVLSKAGVKTAAKTPKGLLNAIKKNKDKQKVIYSLLSEY